LRISSWSFAPLVLIGLGGAWFALRPPGADPQAALAARGEEIFQDPVSPVGGNPKGDATLVEFFDYNCPYCRQMVPLLSQTEAADPLLRVAYKEFPVLGAGSVFAAKAALAADKQEKFAAFHRALFQIRGSVDESKTLAAAATAGLDVERLKSDMRDPAIETMVNNNLSLARALRINDTPGFVIGRRILVGPVPLGTLQAAIQAARAGQQ
jgi:protein-disulfide isomerase